MHMSFHLRMASDVIEELLGLFRWRPLVVEEDFSVIMEVHILPLYDSVELSFDTWLITKTSLPLPASQQDNLRPESLRLYP